MATTAQRTAWVYTSKESSRGAGEGPYFAEVITNPGHDDEAVLHTTGFHTNPHSAINDAETWMKANNVADAAD